MVLSRRGEGKAALQRMGGFVNIAQHFATSLCGLKLQLFFINMHLEFVNFVVFFI